MAFLYFNSQTKHQMLCKNSRICRFVNSEFVVWCHELVQDAAENAEGDENKEDECEEAWEYLEFLKAEIK